MQYKQINEMMAGLFFSRRHHPKPSKNLLTQFDVLAGPSSRSLSGKGLERATCHPRYANTALPQPSLSDPRQQQPKEQWFGSRHAKLSGEA
jgi:hypothetical protein